MRLRRITALLVLACGAPCGAQVPAPARAGASVAALVDTPLALRAAIAAGTPHIVITAHLDMTDTPPEDGFNSYFASYAAGEPSDGALSIRVRISAPDGAQPRFGTGAPQATCSRGPRMPRICRARASRSRATSCATATRPGGRASVS